MILKGQTEIQGKQISVISAAISELGSSNTGVSLLRVYEELNGPFQVLVRKTDAIKIELKKNQETIVEYEVRLSAVKDALQYFEPCLPGFVPTENDDKEEDI